MKDRRLYVRISEEMLKKFDKAIEGLAGDRSDHVRQAMMEYEKRLRVHKMDVEKKTLVS